MIFFWVIEEMEHSYNRFFYPNVCHVCKGFGKAVPLRRCGDCKMISYCSQEHQMRHRPWHRNLCLAINHLTTDNKFSHFFNENIKHDQEAWLRFKMNFMLLVRTKMPRKLEYYEEQMFKFMRACAVCHQRDSKALTNCEGCPSTSFCVKHKSDSMHKQECKSLRLCFNLDITLSMQEIKIPHAKAPKCTKQMPNNMRDFIQWYIERETILQLSLEEENAINAEYLTRPLTLLYAIHKIQWQLKNDCLIIHVIGANMMEMAGTELWEILLHWLPKISSIKIILIGPELSQGSMAIDLCKDCILREKKLTIEFYGGLYETYTVCNSFLQPHFIIGYNAGIHECVDFQSTKDTWMQSLKAIAKQNCPFILTAYTMLEAEKEKTRLNDVLGTLVPCTYYAKNPYSSLKPYRDCETAGVYYQNQYLIIYNNINNDSVQASR